MTSRQRAAAASGGCQELHDPRGFARCRKSCENLARVERPKVVETVSWAAGNGDRSENGDYIYGKQRLREIDRRIRYLTKRIEIAQVVDPAQQKSREQIFFGATVTYANAKASRTPITIVGVDEAIPDAEARELGLAPIARALLKAHEGDTVELATPTGAESIEVDRYRLSGHRLSDGQAAGSLFCISSRRCRWPASPGRRCIISSGCEKLGYEAWYVENHGANPYDPRANSVIMDCDYNVDFLKRRWSASASPAAGPIGTRSTTSITACRASASSRC